MQILPIELEAFRKEAFAEYANSHKRDTGFTRLGVDAFGNYVVINNGKKHKFVAVDEAISVFNMFVSSIETRFVLDYGMTTIFSFESNVELPRFFILQMQGVTNVEQTQKDGGFLVEIVYIRKYSPRQIYAKIVELIRATDTTNE